MPFTLTIETDNEAFGDDPTDEVARILREVAGQCAETSTVDLPAERGVYDVNGNRVGTWILALDTEG